MTDEQPTKAGTEIVRGCTALALVVIVLGILAIIVVAVLVRFAAWAWD